MYGYAALPHLGQGFLTCYIPSALINIKNTKCSKLYSCILFIPKAKINVI